MRVPVQLLLLRFGAIWHAGWACSKNSFRLASHTQDASKSTHSPAHKRSSGGMVHGSDVQGEVPPPWLPHAGGH